MILKIYKPIVLLLLLCLFDNNLSFSQSNNVESTAIDYLRDNLKNYGLLAQDIDDYLITDNYKTKHNGVTHFYIQQKYQNIKVYNAITNFNILPSGEVLSMYNRFIPNLANKINTTTPIVSAEKATLILMEYFDIPTINDLVIKERIGENQFIIDNEGLALEPIEVALVLEPINKEKVRLAWNVSFYTLDAQHWWIARVDAVNGEILDYSDRVIHCDFGPGEGHSCTKDHVHHEEKEQKETYLPVLTGTSNVYNAYPLQIESPNHGDRELICDPADEIASPFGWHDTDGQEGPEFTITRGNNVHAYQDIFNFNSSLGDEPDGGDSLVFDFEHNLSLGTPFTEIDAAVTNLFVWNNFMHDWWYQYGFDEASGNFQENNYGNGGQGSDFVNAQALDGSGTNNANMATPADGSNPRMQMFYWGGGEPAPEFSPFEFEVTAPMEVAGAYAYAIANFGPDLPRSDDPITGKVILVDDGVANPNVNDACEPIINGAAINGNIAMVDRGDCEFSSKVLDAQNEGAIAVIVCAHTNQAIFNMPGGVDAGDVEIPSVMVSLEDCNLLKTQIADLEISIADRFIILPTNTGRDSDFDNGIIAHEYTHGISNRLTGGPNSAGCLDNDEQAGEGWSDWFGLVMTHTADMTAEQGRGIGTFASGQSTDDDGIRQYAYSRDMTVNPHTYANTPNVSVPHGVGSVWCVMIWDLYWNFIDLYGFDENFYNGEGGNNMAMQLVIDGLKFQPCEPNFIEARDAIVQADQANYGGIHKCMILETFARRGLGASAQPGGDEAFDIDLLCREELIILKNAPNIADAGDDVTFNLRVINGTPEAVENIIITDVLPEGASLLENSISCSGSVTDGTLMIDLGNIPANQTLECSYRMETSPDQFSYIVDRDPLQLGSSSNWEKSNGGGDDNWSFTSSQGVTGNFVYRVENVSTGSDQILMWKDEIFLDDDNPAFGFWHKYDTQEGRDGGVLEISVNGGDWQDIGNAAIINGYNGTISPTANSALAGRAVFTGDSGNDFIQTIIDLTEFSGETIQLRFRFATDSVIGGDGWEFDDFELFGNFFSLSNSACITDNEGVEICDETFTILFGDPSTSVLDKILENSVNIFPNPNKGEFMILFPETLTEEIALEIVNVNGQILQQQTLKKIIQQEIDLSEFGTGVYFVKLKTERGIATKRVVIQ